MEALPHPVGTVSSAERGVCLARARTKPRGEPAAAFVDRRPVAQLRSRGRRGRSGPNVGSNRTPTRANSAHRNGIVRSVRWTPRRSHPDKSRWIFRRTVANVGQLRPGGMRMGRSSSPQQGGGLIRLRYCVRRPRGEIRTTSSSRTRSTKGSSPDVRTSIAATGLVRRIASPGLAVMLLSFHGFPRFLR